MIELTAATLVAAAGKALQLGRLGWICRALPHERTTGPCITFVGDMMARQQCLDIDDAARLLLGAVVEEVLAKGGEIEFCVDDEAHHCVIFVNTPGKQTAFAECGNHPVLAALSAFAAAVEASKKGPTP
jgi:hypothetical protein